MKKNIIFLLALVFVLASCGKQEVVNNQPTVASDIKVKEIQKIEEKQGPILEDISVDIIKSDASDIKVKEIQKIEEKQGNIEEKQKKIEEKQENILESLPVNIIKSDISPDEYDKFLSGALTFSGIDIDSFKKLSNNYFKDKNNIYFGGCGMGCAIRSLTGIDYDSFEIIGGDYSKDKNNVYYKIFKIDGIDSKDFTYIPGGDNFAKSGNNFFVCGKYLSGFNANSFTHLGYRYIKDDKNTYFGGDLCDYTIVTGSANK